jgi:hypothetical protein
MIIMDVRFIKDWSRSVDGVRSQRYTKGLVTELPADVEKAARKAGAIEDAVLKIDGAKPVTDDADKPTGDAGKGSTKPPAA